MTETSLPGNHLSILVLEGLFALVALGFSIAWPNLGSTWFSRIEKAFAKFARRKGLSVLAVGSAALLLRLAVLPFWPIPLPFVPDDFSFLLAADTFLHGRLTNPTPAMWTHFESFHITMVPTYMSMYFPAQGLILAAGKLLFGHPWFGLLCVTALMCAAICWMLQAWLPPEWALLGGLLAVLRLALFSYWINTYTGAGSVAALGGALVLGAFPRIFRTVRLRDGLLLATGIVVLGLSRPYEGMLVCLPVLFFLARWIFFGKNRPANAVLLRRVALPLALVVAAGLWLGYYDQRNFGSPLTLPYTIDRATYAVAPYWIWEPPRPEPAYRHKVFRDFYVKGEEKIAANYHTRLGFVLHNLFKPVMAIRFFAGITLLPPLIMLPRVVRDRSIRFLLLSCLVWMAGMFIVVFLLPHYLAPFTAGLYAIGLQCMRHLRVWKPGRLPIGQAMTRLMLVSCMALAIIRIWAGPLHLALTPGPVASWVLDWFGPAPLGQERAQVKHSLENLPGKQLVLIRYSDSHEPFNEWVYNAPDIDNSKVIWAREMDAASNLDLMRHYSDRRVWLVEPDRNPTGISPYTSPQLASNAPYVDTRECLYEMNIADSYKKDR